MRIGWVLLLGLAACGGEPGQNDGNELVETTLEECGATEALFAVLECGQVGVGYEGCYGAAEACTRYLDSHVVDAACLAGIEPDAQREAEDTCAQLADVFVEFRECGEPTLLWPEDPATWTCDGGA